MDDALLTAAETAALFGVDTATVRRWTVSGALVAQGGPRSRRYRREDMLALLEERTSRMLGTIDDHWERT